MIGSFRSEWLRLRKRPAVWILALALLAILLLLSYLLVWLIFTFPPKGLATAGTTPAQIKQSLYPAKWLRTVLSSTTGLGAAVALVMGVLAAGSEYGWGTVKTMVTQRPGRLSALAGKGLALAAALAILAVALLASGAAASALFAAVDGRSSAWPGAVDALKALGAAWLVLAVYAGLGMWLAIMFRQSALAVGIGLIYALVIESLVAALLGNVDPFRGVVEGLPGSNASSLVAAFGAAAGGRAAATSATVGAGQAALVLLGYLAAFAVISAAVFRRRDIG